MSERFSSSASGISPRTALIIGGVLFMHVAALWALQSGLLRRVAEVVIPVALLSEFVDPPKPIVQPPPPPPAAKPQPRQAVRTARPAPQPPPQPMAIRDPAPAPAAPTGTLTPPPPAPPAEPTPVAAPAPAAPPAPPSIQLPSTDADYAQSCSPTYPTMSRRLGEQGRVLVRVMVGADGQPRHADVKKSSGFERLDAAAREAMLRCRFVPGKVNGVAQSMAWDAPINFILN